MSTINCSLKDLAKVLEKEIRNEVKQTRFAAMKALNEVAFKARGNLIDEYKKSFVVRNTNLPRAITIKKATKENLSVEVAFPKDWMYINTVGGDKKPENSKLLMVPIKDGDLKDYRTSSGKIKQSKKPVALLKYHNAHPDKPKGKGRGKVANPHPFLITSKKNGRTLIAVRDKVDRGNMKWLYVGVPVGDVKKRWDFENIVKETAEKELPKEFEKQFKKAMATAK